MQLRKTPNPNGRVNGTRLRMLRKIWADGMQTVAELADALGIEQRSVRVNATQAIMAGLLEKRLDGVTRTLAYSLTKAGRDYVLRRQHESENAEPENATADHVAGNPHAQQAPDDVETRPMPPSDTEQERADDDQGSYPSAEPLPETASSDDMHDQDDVICPELSTAYMLRMIMAINEPMPDTSGIARSVVSSETTQKPVAGAPPDAQQEHIPLSLADCVEKLRATGAYAFARFENGRVVVEWITQTADEAFNELKTSHRDAIVFKVAPVAMAQRTVTFVD